MAYGIKVRNLASVTEKRSATRKWRPMAIAKALGIGRASVYRVLESWRSEAKGAVLRAVPTGGH